MLTPSVRYSLYVVRPLISYSYIGQISFGRRGTMVSAVARLLHITSRLPPLLPFILAAVISELIISCSMAFSLRSTSLIRRGYVCRSSGLCRRSVGNTANNRKWIPLLDSNYIDHKDRVQSLQRSYISSTRIFASTMNQSNSNSNISAPSSSQKQSISSNSTTTKEEETWSDYERLVRKLYMTNLFNPVKLGLENMDRLHKILGSPMDKVSNNVLCV